MNESEVPLPPIDQPSHSAEWAKSQQQYDRYLDLWERSIVQQEVYNRNVAEGMQMQKNAYEMHARSFKTQRRVQRWALAILVVSAAGFGLAIYFSKS